MVEIILVPGPVVPEVWAETEPHLLPSIALAHGCFEPHDVVVLCVAGAMQLWIAADGEEIIGATITEIVDFPRKRAARIVFAGGKNLRRWYGLMDKAVDEWSRSWGCHAILAGGRRGWSRLAKMEETGVLFWRDLAEPSTPSSNEVH